jgi:serine phosphatase RsbU (regulator of sigma subunit)
MGAVTTLFSEWGAASAAREGETVSGDRYSVTEGSSGLLIVAVDGVGHGPVAEEIAAATIFAIAREPERSLPHLLQRCHHALQGTRGAALLLARVASPPARLAWIGVGQIFGVVVRADPGTLPRREPLLVRHGVVGRTLGAAVEFSTPVGAGDLVVLASDGVHEAFADHLPSRESPDRIASQVLQRHRKASDDAMVVVVRLRRES